MYKNKLYIFIFNLLLIGNLSFGQVSLSGKIDNLPNNSFLTIYDYKNNTSPLAINVLRENINDNGSFSILLNITNPEEIHFEISTESEESESIFLYLEPKDSLTLTGDFYDFDNSLGFFGKGSSHNIYLIKEKQEDYFDKVEEGMDLSPSDFLIHLNKVYTEHLEFYQSFDSTLFSEEFKQLMEVKLKYEYIDYKFDYLAELEQEVDEDEFTNFLDFYKDIDFELNEYADNSEYSSVLKRYFTRNYSNLKDEYLSEEIGIWKNSWLVSRYMLFEKILKGRVRAHQLTGLIAQASIWYTDENELNFIIHDFLSWCEIEEYKALVNEIEENNKRIKTGNKAPSFTVEDIDGNTVNLDDFLGKVVYIDFWATWCIPCINSMHEVEDIAIEYKDEEDVQVIYVSVFDDRGAWEEFLKNKSHDGMHLFANQSAAQDISINYQMGGVPYYALIDKDGNFIFSREFKGKNELINLIDEYLEK